MATTGARTRAALAGPGLGDSPSFGAVLRRFRCAAGLTHEALAEAASLSARTVSDLERGVSTAPRRDTLAALAAALGLTPEQQAALELAARRAPEAAHATVRRHNLPLQLSTFVGREQELGEVEALVRQHRLATLTGAGGCGKTRLALRATADLLDAGAYTDGAWLVDLAAITDAPLSAARDDPPIRAGADAGGRGGHGRARPPS